MASVRRMRAAWWTALVAAVAVGPAWAQEGGADAGAGAAPTEEKVPPKVDVTDIRNAIGNLDMVRGFNNLTNPQKPGTWQKLIDLKFYPPEVNARKLLLHGQYARAEAEYNKLLKDHPAEQEYIENDLEAILLQGHESDRKRFGDKYATLTREQKGTAKVTRLQAQALVAGGRGDEAKVLLRRWAEAHPKPAVEDGEALRVYVDYARLCERDAEFVAAAGIYRQVTELVAGKLPTDAQAATQLAVAVYRGSLLAGDGQMRNRSAMAELKKVREDDQTYWPAMLAEAAILAAAHNDRDTGQAVGQVLDLNPNELESQFLSVTHAIEQYNFDSADAVLKELKRHTDVAEVKAFEGRLLLKERLPEQAMTPLLAAVKQDPRLPEARGWLAGAYYLLNDPAKMDEQLGSIQTGIGRHPAALFEAAEILRDARQFKTAEKLYLEAQQGAQWWSEPAAALAELYLEMGYEDKAQVAHERSYKLDPYNLRAVNQLKLLEILQGFSSKESAARLKPGSDRPAFIVRYAKGDEILAGLALEWMEKVRPEIWSYFQVTEMAEPTVIEFFPSHEEFSVRTTGLPWIGTVGASTGNVIAMDVPRSGSKNQMGTFDWARVLRHEYTHTVTLAMTNNRVPHWLTEACAVAQEESPRDWDNCQLLCSNYRAGTLFKIADLNWGFIRPKRSVDRQLAYMQSQWIYEFLMEKYGKQKILDFLQCFHEGLTESKAWMKAYGKTMEEIDKEFLPWAGKQIDGWGLPSDPLPKREVVDAALKKDPNDQKALFQLAWLMAGRGDNAQAKVQLEKLVALDPKNVKARELLGAVLNSLKQTEAARTMLEGVVAEEAKSPPPLALRVLGLMAMDAKKYEDAEKWFVKLQAVRPLEQISYSSLAGIYLSRKENDKAIAQLMELERHEQRDERIPRKLADLYLETKRLPEAEGAAYRAVRINPYSAVNHQLLAQILVQEKKPEKAVEYWAHATALQPKLAELWEGLAEVKGALGDKAGAAAAARKALEIDPKSKAEKWMK